MDPIEQKLNELITEQKGFIVKAQAELTNLGTITTETRTALTKLQAQVDAIDLKLAQRAVSGNDGPSLRKALEENESLQRLMRDGKGNAVIKLEQKHVDQMFGRKTLISETAVGSMTTGVLPIERTPGIVPEARRALNVRDVLPSRPTTRQLIDFVKVNAAMARASMQTEGSAKAENAVTFTTVDEAVRTIATWIPATRQILDDWTELEGFLRSTLPYYVNLEEEYQLLTGDNTGQNLNGLCTQATAFDTSLLVAADGWTRIDIIGRAIEQIGTANELDPTFVVLPSAMWWSIRLTKDGMDNYILGPPMGDVANPNIFGLTLVRSNCMTAGKFLVGNGTVAGCEIRDRMGMEIAISTEHSTYFTENKVAIRAEKRLALVVYRPASYIYGTFTTSP